MPDLSHLWQRFLLASSLLVGLLIGAAATVFGYSNLGAVDVRWSLFHLDDVPLWTVAVVPLALVLIAGTLYHWMDGLHHFTEHMRHRRRVNELEAEIVSLRAHLDHVLEMPDQSSSRLSAKHIVAATLPPAEDVTELAPTEMEALPGPVEQEVGTGGSAGRAQRKSSGSRRHVAHPVSAEPVAASAAGAGPTEVAAPSSRASEA
ncbi:hypothetical protein EPN29_07905 [bacterium]|nr:MAG: hypothetical protein EPN29_07905 [bacterium]